MGEQTISRGQNTFVASTKPNSNNADLFGMRVSGSTRRTFLVIPLPSVLGRTIISASLSPRFRGAIASQTLTVQAVSAKWSVDKVTWNNQPAVRPGTATKVTGALADGARTDIDVTALVQQVANGLPHYGWRIVTSDATGATFYGFAGADSWVLTVETSDAPQQPTTLNPSGDGVISLSKFVVATDFTDTGGSGGIAAIHVQVDPDQTTPFAFDSGWVTTTVPELDLATTAYAGLADGATTKWRVQVRDADGLDSPWSDWASVKRVAKPTLTLDVPVGGVLGDPTSIVQAHLESGAITRYSIQITDGMDRSDIRFASGAQPATGSAALAFALPKRNSDGDIIFRDDITYQLRVRVSDRNDRVRGGPTDPPYIELWQTIVFDDDIATTAPTTLNATPSPAGPTVTLTWYRVSAADGWLIYRDGKRIAILDPSDVTVSSGSYTWVDPGGAPNQVHTWEVKALVNGKQSAGVSDTETVTVEGVWLLSRFGNVKLTVTDISGLARRDRRATYSLPFRPDDIDIIGALGNISGPIKGAIAQAGGVDVDTARTVLEQIRTHPTERVQLIYGTVSDSVLLRNLLVTPSADFLPSTSRQHAVTFEVI